MQLLHSGPRSCSDTYRHMHVRTYEHTLVCNACMLAACTSAQLLPRQVRHWSISKQWAVEPAQGQGVEGCQSRWSCTHDGVQCTHKRCSPQHGDQHAGSETCSDLTYSCACESIVLHLVYTKRPRVRGLLLASQSPIRQTVGLFCLWDVPRKRKQFELVC
jgi:hypothetical protein